MDMDQRNLIIAIALSIAILIGFNFFFEPARRVAPPPPPQASQSAPVSPAPSAGVPAAVPNAPSAAAPAAGPSGPESRAAALEKSPRVKISTPRLHGSIALVGGRIDDLTLAQYHE